MKTFINQVSITAYLTQDCEVRTFSSASVARFSIAISRNEKRGEELVRKVAYLPCEMWRHGKTSDSFAKLTKGAYLNLTGRLSPDEYVDKSGVKHHRIIFTVSKVESVEETKEQEG